MKRNFLFNTMLVALASPFMLKMAEETVASEKKVKFCDKDYDVETGEVSFKFGDGETISCNAYELNDKIQKTLMLHGLSQKGGDSYAGAKGNYAEAKASLQDVISMLQSGEWTAGRDGDAKPRLGELSEAIARVKSVDIETATAAVEAASEDKRKEWRAHPRIKAAIAAIRAEKAQAELEKSTAGEISL